MSSCAWCGKPATATRVVEPDHYAKRRNDSGELEEVLVKRAITASVCPEHVAIFERADRIKALTDQRDHLNRQRRKPDANARALDGLLEEVTRQLRDLGWVDPRKPRQAAAA